MNQKNLAEEARNLLNEQKRDWEKCRSGYESACKALYKNFDFEFCTIKVQYNPERIISTAAKVDEDSIQKRKCFLCRENLPPEQKALWFNEEFLILCNPFPIFPEHFTISHRDHVPQKIGESFGSLFELSKELSKHYTVFYNGPKCGASAPDHLHFQAGSKLFMPVESEINLLKASSANTILNNDLIYLAAIDDGLRRFILLESSDPAAAEEYFFKIYNALDEYSIAGEEPMLNIICSYVNEAWKIIVFPREKHRPSHYFREDERRLLLSPASVDLGGVCIVPLESDFNRITKADIQEIFDEVMVDKFRFKDIVEKLS